MLMLRSLAVINLLTRFTVNDPDFPMFEATPVASTTESEPAPNEVRFGPNDAEMHRRLRLNDRDWSAVTPEIRSTSDRDDNGEEVRVVL